MFVRPSFVSQGTTLNGLLNLFQIFTVDTLGQYCSEHLGMTDLTWLYNSPLESW